jgi:hypothetical protein
LPSISPSPSLLRHLCGDPNSSHTARVPPFRKYLPSGFIDDRLYRDMLDSIDEAELHQHLPTTIPYDIVDLPDLRCCLKIATLRLKSAPQL